MSIAAIPSFVKGRQFFQNLVCQIEQDIERLTARRIGEALEQSVERLLGRSNHERRSSSDFTKVEARIIDF